MTRWVVFSLFSQAGLPAPEHLILGDMERFDDLMSAAAVLGSSSSSLDQRFSLDAEQRLDAIVTDPPYGLMEGLGKFCRPLSQRLTSLLDLASRRLRVGGRLVFLLPVPASVDESAAMPSGLIEALRLESISRQRLSPRMHRLMITMVKVAEPEEVVAGEHAVAAAEECPRGAAGGQWEEWWRTIDAIERANAGEARRVW